MNSGTHSCLSRGTAIEDRAADWLARRDAGLDAAGERTLARWLAADPENRAAFERLDSTWAALDRPRQTGRVGAVIDGLARRARRRQHRRTVAFAAVASLALLGAIWRSGVPTGREANQPVQAMAGVATLQRLPDGTMVELRSGAEITVAFEAGSRRVILEQGEAHFHVTRDPERPFVVQAGRVEVRAVGTAFAVRNSPDEVEVLVTEGQVAVDGSRDRRPAVAGIEFEAGGNHEPAAGAAVGSRHGPGLLLGAGQRVLLPADTPEEFVPEVAPMSDVDYSQRLAWRGLRLEFSGASLAEAVKQFNTRNRVQLIVADSAAAELQISGIFRAHNVDGFVRLLESSFGVKVEREGEERIRLHRAR